MIEESFYERLAERFFTEYQKRWLKAAYRREWLELPVLERDAIQEAVVVLLRESEHRLMEEIRKRSEKA